MKRFMLTPLQVHMFGVALTGLIGVAGYLLTIEPALDERDAAMRRSAELANADRDALVAEANLRVSRRELEQRRARLESLAIRLEPVSRTNDRMVRLTQLAEQSGLVVSTIEPSSPSAQGKHLLVPVKLVGTGSFKHAHEFLAQIKQQFPDTRVDGLQITAAAAADVPGQIQLECTWFAARNEFAEASPTSSASSP